MGEIQKLKTSMSLGHEEDVMKIRAQFQHLEDVYKKQSVENDKLKAKISELQKELKEPTMSSTEVTAKEAAFASEIERLVQ